MDTCLCNAHDTIKCLKVNDYEYILTVIDLFSRWRWLIPLQNRDGPSIGAALLKTMFGPYYCWPVVHCLAGLLGASFLVLFCGGGTGGSGGVAAVVVAQDPLPDLPLEVLPPKSI